MAYYASPLTALISGLTQGLTQGGVDWWRSKLAQKEFNRQLGIKGILQAFQGASPEGQAELAMQAKRKFGMPVAELTDIVYQAPGGGPLTPSPGTDLSQLQQTTQKRYALPAPPLDDLKAAAFSRMSPEEQTRSMRGLDSLGAEANYLNALLNQQLWALGGPKERQVRVQEDRLPIARDQAEASMTQAEAAQRRADTDVRELDEVKIPGHQLDAKKAADLQKYRDDSIRLIERAQKSKVQREQFDGAINAYNAAANAIKVTTERMKLNRDRRLRRSEDEEADMQDARMLQQQAMQIAIRAYQSASVPEQKGMLEQLDNMYKDWQKQQKGKK